MNYLESFHEPGCPAIADDESDYEYLNDAGQCTCNRKKIPYYPKISKINKELRIMLADALRCWRKER